MSTDVSRSEAHAIEGDGYHSIWPVEQGQRRSG